MYSFLLSIGILVADRFFNENAFYSNLYRAVLKCAAEQDTLSSDIATRESSLKCV